MAKRANPAPEPAPEPAPASAKLERAVRRREIDAAASASAPFIYFDSVPNFGVHNGVVNVTLETVRYTAPDQAVITDRVIVAHLRMSVATAKALKVSLEKALLLAAPVAPGQPN